MRADTTLRITSQIHLFIAVIGATIEITMWAVEGKAVRPPLRDLGVWRLPNVHSSPLLLRVIDSVPVQAIDLCAALEKEWNAAANGLRA